MFGRIRVPGSPTYNALLLPDAGHRHRADSQIRAGGRSRQHRGAKIRHARPLVEDNLRIIKDGIKADDRVIVNGLMRVRPNQKVTPQEPGGTPGAAGPQAKAQ